MNRKWLVVLAVSYFLGLSGWSDAPPAQANAATGAPALQEADATATADDPTVTRPAGWTEATHGNAADPNYEVVFPQDKVNQITITIAPENWTAMQADLVEILGPGDTDVGDYRRRNPIWVPAIIDFEGKSWTNVGVRYRGLSTLRDAWREGSSKLPLKLDFDQFEDQYPEIRNQRFHGFKQLALANNLYDDSYLRDTLAYDLLKEAGLVAAETAHYEVVLDYGEGSIEMGLYTMIEVMDDTVINRHFGDDSGNIYEGDGPAASLAEGTFHLIPDSFQKENNEREGDWSDIEVLYGVLHSWERTTDPDAWRAGLESVFDVSVFLKWLAIGAVIDHWDAYGWLPHNYYLYNHPRTGLLTWISWDHDLILEGRDHTSPNKQNIGAEWPLIRYLLDDPVYYAAYLGYLEEMVNGVFDLERMEAKYRGRVGLLEPYAAKESRQRSLQVALADLFWNARVQVQIVNEFLASQGISSR